MYVSIIIATVLNTAHHQYLASIPSSSACLAFGTWSSLEQLQSGVLQNNLLISAKIAAKGI
jgi:hypothetical protein